MIFKMAFFLVFLSFVLGQLARFQTGYIALTALDITVGILGIVVLLEIIFKKRIPKGSFLTVSWLFFLSLLLSLLVNISRFKSEQILIGFLYFLRLIGYWFLYLAALEIKNKKYLLYLMFFSGTVIVLGGFLQYFFYPNLRNLYYLGWDEHLYRMFSSFLDPNFLGTFFVLFLLFALGNIGIFYLKTHNKISKLAYVFVVFSTLLGVFLTFSRGSMLMLLVSLGLFFILINRKKLLTVLLLLFITAFLIFSSKFYIENINWFRTASINARFTNFESALTIFSKNPMFGVGFNTYRFARQKTTLADKFPNHAASGTDNSLLFIAATSGVVGLISFLLLVFKIIDILREKIATANSLPAKALLASLAGLLLNSMFLNSLFYPSVMLWVWINLALIERE